MDRKKIITLILLIICLCIPIGVRLIELPKWNNPAYEINGEKIMATHDAYYFLANAMGTGRNPSEPLGLMVRAISNITNIPSWKIGFFSQAVACSILVIPLIFLARYYDLLPGIMPAAILGSCCIGYLSRTRLGFLDTDFGALGLLVAFCTGLSIFIDSLEKQPQKSKPFPFLLPIITGIIGAIYMWFYGTAKPVALFTLAVGFIVALFIKQKNKMEFSYPLLGFFFIFILTFDFIIGIIIVLFLLGYFLTSKKVSNSFIYSCMFLSLIVVIFHSELYLLFYKSVIKTLKYAKIIPYLPDTEHTIILPSVLQSIKEAQNLDFHRAIIRMAYNIPTFLIGIIGLIYLFIKKPSSLVFIIFILLGISSVKLGNRFSMYGGMAIGMGIGFGLGLFFKKLLPKSGQWIFQIVITILILIPTINIAKKFKPAPILPKIYAATFKELEKITTRDARLWQWWDYGYAAQYFAKRPSFGDGGVHDGPFLYPLAVVHTSSSPIQAANLIKYITKSQLIEYITNKEKYEKKDLPKYWQIYLADPVAQLDKMGRENAKKFIDSLKQKILPIKNIPSQYLVLSWENLKLAYWICYFGTWDISLGEAFPGKIQSVSGKIEINLGSGEMTINNKNIKLDGILIIDKHGRTREMTYSHGTDIYAILNELSNELFLADSIIYHSNMVQMLLKPPKEFAPHFTLVIDHAPWTRVYKVN